MHSIYDWLDQNYLTPKLQQHYFPDYSQKDKDELARLLSLLPQQAQLDATDLVARLQEDYSNIAFTYGVQFGVSLMTQLL